MCAYQPDPPIQTYWPDEPGRYWADYHGVDYWPDYYNNGYYPDAPAAPTIEADESSIWDAPVLAPSPGQSRFSQSNQPPSLRLVPRGKPPICGGRFHAHPQQGGSAPKPLIRDRRVALIAAKHSLEILIEAGDEDGFTRADLMPYLNDLEETLKKVQKQVRGSLLQRVSRWVRDES